MYKFFMENNLISPNQLLSITHDIYKLIDYDYEVRAKSHDLSKTFESLRHLG